MSLVIRDLIMARDFFKEAQLEDVVNSRTAAGNFNMLDLYDLDSTTIKAITNRDPKVLLREMRQPAAFYKMLIRTAHTLQKLPLTIIDLYDAKKRSIATLAVSTLQQSYLIERGSVVFDLTQYGEQWNYIDKTFSDVYCVQTRTNHEFNDDLCIYCSYPKKLPTKQQLHALFRELFIMG